MTKNADNHDDKAKVVEAAKPAQKQVQSLVEFFRQSPLMGLNLDLERDKSPGRDVDLGFDE
jgi:hypothetical protein